MVRCVDCTQMTLRDHPNQPNDERSLRTYREMAKHGFSRCVLGEAWRFWPPMREKSCKKFTPALANAIEARVQWLTGK